MDVKNAKLTGKQRRRPRLAAGRASDCRQAEYFATTWVNVFEKPASKRGSGCANSRGGWVCPASLISQIETGKTEPSIKTLFAIVSELELSVNEIVFDAKQDADPPSERCPSGVRTVPVRAAERGSLVRPTHPDRRSSAARTEHRSASSPASAGNGSRRSPITTSTSSTSAIRRGASRLLHDSLMRHNGTEYGYILSGTAPGLDRIRHVRDRAGRHDRIRLHAAAPLRNGRG